MSSYLNAWDIDTSLVPISEGTVEVLAYANKSNYYFPYFLKSSNRHGYPLKILGWDTTWKGYSSKLHLVYNYLIELNDIYKNRYMLLVDAWDVIFTRDYIDLIAELNTVNYDLIISSSYSDALDQSNHHIRYIVNYLANKAFSANNGFAICAGVYIIRINKFIELFERCMPQEECDDQVLITKYLINLDDDIQLNYIIDHGRYYFITMNPMSNNDNILQKENIK